MTDGRRGEGELEERTAPPPLESVPPQAPEPPPRAAAEDPPSADAERLAAEYLDQLQRLKAEFDNYRKRVLREREDWFAAARAETVRRFVPVLDDLRRARAHQQASQEAADVAGLLLILKRFEEILNQLGLTEQEAGKGTVFDPEHHEAVMTAASLEIPEGQVVQVIEPGYLIQDRLLRPSKVVVSSGPATE